MDDESQVDLARFSWCLEAAGYNGRHTNTTELRLRTSQQDLVTDADDKLLNLILYSKRHVYTVYFLIVQILIIVLGKAS